MTSKAEEQIRKLVVYREQLMKEMEALRNKLLGVETSLSLLTDESDEPFNRYGDIIHPKKIATSTLRDLLEEVGNEGLNTPIALELARRRGAYLERSTVSTILSKMKRQGLIFHDGDRYRLAKFMGEPANPKT